MLFCLIRESLLEWRYSCQMRAVSFFSGRNIAFSVLENFSRFFTFTKTRNIVKSKKNQISWILIGKKERALTINDRSKCVITSSSFLNYVHQLVRNVRHCRNWWLKWCYLLDSLYFQWLICLTHRQTRSSLFYSLGCESHRMYKGRLFLLKIERKESKPGNKFTGPKNKEFWRKCLSLSHCLPLRKAWGVYLSCFNYIDWRNPKVDVEQPLWLDRFRFSTDETSFVLPLPHSCMHT